MLAVAKKQSSDKTKKSAESNINTNQNTTHTKVHISVEAEYQGYRSPSSPSRFRFQWEPRPGITLTTGPRSPGAHKGLEGPAHKARRYGSKMSTTSCPREHAHHTAHGNVVLDNQCATNASTPPLPRSAQQHNYNHREPQGLSRNHITARSGDATCAANPRSF